MSDLISIVVRSADNTRQAVVTLPVVLTIEQLLEKAQQQWNMPANTSYAMRLQRTNEQLQPSATLQSLALQENDVLEFYPLLEAG